VPRLRVGAVVRGSGVGQSGEVITNPRAILRAKEDEVEVYGVWAEPIAPPRHAHWRGSWVGRADAHSPLYAVRGWDAFGRSEVYEIATGRVLAVCLTDDAAHAAWRLLHAGLHRIRMSRAEADGRAASFNRSFRSDFRYEVRPISGPPTLLEVIL
jgi:hypothetical protein